MSSSAPSSSLSPATADAPTPKLLKLAWPIFVEHALRVLIGFVDTLMVSHLGDNAVAGVDVANQVVTLFIIAFAFIGIGSSIVVTHHLGAKDRAGADRISVTAIAANTWIGVIASVLVFAFAAPMLSAMQLPPGPTEFALPFLVLMGGTLFFEAMNVSIAATLRAHTHTRDAMFVTFGQNVLNVIGNCLLLFGLLGFPKLGVLGVALSGVVSRIAANIALWIILRRRVGLRLRLPDFLKLPRDRLRRILSIGLPAAGEHTSWWLAFITINAFINGMGADAMPTKTFAFAVIRWVIVLNVSIGLGTEIIVGQLVGAGRFDAAYRELVKNLRTSFFITLLVSAALAALAPQLIDLFTDTPVIIATGAVLIRMGLLLEPGRVFNVVVINSLRATGDARFPVFVGIIGMWGVWVPLAWLFGVKFGWGLPGIWISMICDEWIRGLIMFWRWRSRRWLPYAERSRAKAQATALGEAEGTTVAQG